MKKLALLLVVAAFAAAPAAATTKHTKHKTIKQPTEAEQIAQQRENTKHVLIDSLPVVLPTWSLPIFFSIHKDEDKDTKKK